MAHDHPVTAGPPQLVVMGVAGSGKTTVGSALARRLGIPFADSDGLHPQANIAKMRAGTPLTDADRAPWLAAVGRWLAKHPEGGVISCSALRRHYRDQLRAAAPAARFLHLSGPLGDVAGVLTARVAARPDHFMPASLVSSQLELLEPLEECEPGLVTDLSLPVEDIVDLAVAAFTTTAPPSTPSQPRTARPSSTASSSSTATQSTTLTGAL